MSDLPSLLYQKKEPLMSNSSLSLSSLKQYTVIIVSVLISLAAIFYLVIGVQGLLATRDELSLKEQKKEQYDAKLKVLTSQNAPKLNEALTNALLAMPSEYDSPALLNALEKLSDASGVSFSGLQFTAPQGGAALAGASGGFAQHAFSLSTTADFAHVIAMLRHFENTLPIFTINNLTIRSGGENAAGLSLAFGVTTYDQALPTSLGDAATPVSPLTQDETELLEELESYSNYPLIPDTSGVGKTNPFE